MDNNVLNKELNIIIFVVYRPPGWDNKYTNMLMSD